MGTVDLKHLLNWLNLHKCVNVCPSVCLSVSLSARLSVCPLAFVICISCRHFVTVVIFIALGMFFVHHCERRTRPAETFFPIRIVCVSVCVCVSVHTLPALPLSNWVSFVLRS